LVTLWSASSWPIRIPQSGRSSCGTAHTTKREHSRDGVPGICAAASSRRTRPLIEVDCSQFHSPAATDDVSS
jgi:hypothetical protein